MKKIFAILLAACLTVHFCTAQVTATSVSYNKTNKPALMLELPYSEEISENFIIDNLKKTGYDAETKGKLFWKQNKLNGFYIFKEVKLKGAPEKLDLYFKVDRVGKKAREQSVIYLLVARSEENFISSTSDEDSYEAAKNFMNGFVDQSAIYKLQLDIEAQEDQIKDEEKKLNKLSDNEKDMEKKIEQLQKDLKKNREDQEDQKKTIEQSKEKLAELKTALKKST